MVNGDYLLGETWGRGGREIHLLSCTLFGVIFYCVHLLLIQHKQTNNSTYEHLGVATKTSA